MMTKIAFILIVLLQLMAENLALRQTAYVVYDSKADNFILSTTKPKNGYVAYAIFSNTVKEIGWATFEVSTIGSYSDSVQVRAAGFLEGYLSHELIYLNYLNTLDETCDGDEVYCNKVNTWIATNTKWAKEMYTKLRNTDPFWHQVGLFYEQLDGMTVGWNKAAQTSGYSFGKFSLMWLNIVADLEDLDSVLNSNKKRSAGLDKTFPRRRGRPSCSGLIKVLPNFSDILTSQVAWNFYGCMIRILKKYSLKVHTTTRAGSPIVPGYNISFSSYPALLYSLDDFNVISSGLVSLETTLDIYNDTLYKFIKPTGQIFEGIRSLAANRLANSGKEWTDIFRLYNSGTYNNQWMILDYKKFKRGKPLADGLLWVLEQLPSYVEARDMTSVLRSQLYWPSYNVPYFPAVFKLSGQADMVKGAYGSLYSYDRSPRARIFRRDQGNVTDINSMIKLMRSNNYLKDPLSRCSDCPFYKTSPEYAIASRNDLNSADKASLYGAIDCKATSSAMIPTLDFIAVSGPTYDPLPPFQFSRSALKDDLPHFGHPDLWKFPAFRTKWAN